MALPVVEQYEEQGVAGMADLFRRNSTTLGKFSPFGQSQLTININVDADAANKDKFDIHGDSDQAILARRTGFYDMPEGKDAYGAISEEQARQDERAQREKAHQIEQIFESINEKPWYAKTADYVSDSFNSAYDYVADGFNSAIDSVKEGYDYVADKVSGAIDTVKTAWNDGVEGAIKIGKSIKEGVSNAIDTATTAVSDGAKYFANAASNAYTAYVPQVVQDGVTSVKNTVSSAWDSTAQALGFGDKAPTQTANTAAPSATTAAPAQATATPTALVGEKNDVKTQSTLGAMFKSAVDGIEGLVKTNQPAANGPSYSESRPNLGLGM